MFFVESYNTEAGTLNDDASILEVKNSFNNQESIALTLAEKGTTNNTISGKSNRLF